MSKFIESAWVYIFTVFFGLTGVVGGVWLLVFLAQLVLFGRMVEAPPLLSVAAILAYYCMALAVAVLYRRKG